MQRRLGVGLVALVMLACSAEDTAVVGQPVVGGGLAPLSGAPTTADKTLVPKKPRLETPGAQNPALPEGLATYPPDLGDLVEGPGEAHVARALDGSAAPAPGASPKRLSRFVHLADLQLADDESPMRLAAYDGSGPTSSAMRPQDPDLCRLTGAAVRTINALHRKEPLDFVLLGGDNTDSSQSNEVDWLLGILNGGKVECDSGDDDDLIAGPDNDGKDPFVSEGLLVPWKWVTGNHDVLIQGTVPITEQRKQTALGDSDKGGTRGWKQGGVIKDGIAPDARRALLERKEMMARVAGDKDGHGLGEAQRQSGKAFHFFDVPNTPLRFLILDTGAETGGADGMLHQADVDAYVKPALDEAKALGKWVILASHHASGALTEDGGTFGTKQGDALLPDAWRDYAGGYENVVYSMVAHSHENRVEAIQPAKGRGWWEIMTASIADFPHQFRVIEVWDQDNGWLMLRATCVDLAVDGDPVAAEGRRLGLIDRQSGWNPGDGVGKPDARNVELYVRKPGG